jgi:hypothetical protein
MTAADKPRRTDKEQVMSTIWIRRTAQKSTVYQVADRLHQERALRVTSDEIAATVSAWLAELEVESPMVDELADAVRTGNWTAAHALEDLLSVDVTVAA